ncbi:unnamed protein product, partial [Urochloa humidicola]
APASFIPSPPQVTGGSQPHTPKKKQPTATHAPLRPQSRFGSGPTLPVPGELAGGDREREFAVETAATPLEKEPCCRWGRSCAIAEKGAAPRVGLGLLPLLMLL